MYAFNLDTFVHVTTHRAEREAARTDLLQPVRKQTLRTPHQRAAAEAARRDACAARAA